MTYLIAKYALLLIAAAILGFLLGRWWLRRSFVDVTESFDVIAKAASNPPWHELWSRLDALEPRTRQIVREELRAVPQPEPPQIDLEPLRQGIDGFADRLRAVASNAKPKPSDFAPVNDRLDRVVETLDELRKVEPADLAPATARLERIEALVRNMPQPETPAPVDLGPTNARIDRVESLLAGLAQAEPPGIDLGPMNARIDRIESLIAGLAHVEPPRIDFGPTNARIDRVETLLAGLPRPEPAQPVDLAPLEQRLGAVERAIRSIDIPPAPDLGVVSDRLQIIESSISKLSASPVPSAGPRLLRAPTHGAKDDLKRISGVGPKLERLLNDNGVYYFWQIAEWNAADIAVMDDRLDVFKGRISRDDWVRQAQALARTSPARAEPRPAATHADGSAHP